MKINIVGPDPGAESWSRLYDLLEKEVQQKTLSYSLCPYDRSVSDEAISDCDGIIYLEMNPTATAKPFVRLAEDENFDEKLNGFMKMLQRTDPAFQESPVAEGISGRSENKRSRAATAFIVLLLAVALGAIGFNAYLMVKMTREQKEAVNPFPDQSRDTALCMGNITEYQLFFKGQLPARPNLTCPVSGEPYLVNSTGALRIVSCPTPHKHDPALKGLRAVGETPPEVIK